MSLLKIEEFNARYETSDDHGRKAWKPCRVVGIRTDGLPSFMVLVADEDGGLWPLDVPSVRPVVD